MLRPARKSFSASSDAAPVRRRMACRASTELRVIRRLPCWMARLEFGSGHVSRWACVVHLPLSSKLQSWGRERGRARPRVRGNRMGSPAIIVMNRQTNLNQSRKPRPGNAETYVTCVVLVLGCVQKVVEAERSPSLFPAGPFARDGVHIGRLKSGESDYEVIKSSE